MVHKVFVVRLGGGANAGSVRIMDLLQSPCGAVEAAPRITTGGKPGPPIADVLQVAGGQEALA